MSVIPRKTHPDLIGAAQILASGVAFGFLGIFGKSAYSAGLEPGEFLALRFAFAAALMWALALITKQEPLRPHGRLLIHCALLGGLGYAGFSSCYFSALKGLSASLTVLLLYAYPPLVTVGAWAFFGERPPAQALIAMPIAAFGLLLLVWGDLRIENSMAIGYGLMAAVGYSLYILASSRWLREVPALTSMRWVQTFAATVLVGVHLRDPARAAHLVASAWPALLGVAGISTVAAMGLFLAGLKRVTSAEASLLSLGEPVAALALSAALLGERLTVRQAVGGVLVLGALALVAASKPRPDFGPGKG